jgi:aerobic carbon-monoxide dehydrogenase medium subunit
MKPARFDYHDPETLDEAVAILSEHADDGKILAGGQSLVPLLNMRLARPAVIVDVNRVRDSDYVRTWDGGLAVGMTTRLRALHRNPQITQAFPLLSEAAMSIGHPQIRSRGTICGSLAHADPAAELPALAVALDAEMVATGPSGQRVVPASEFYVTFLTTALEPNEILTEARFPAPPADMRWAFLEVSRRHGDFALVGAIAGLTVKDNAITGSRLVYFGVGPGPQRVVEAEQALQGKAPGDAAFAEAAALVSGALDPDDDLHASAAYRRSVAGALTRRALRQAWERASA